MKFQFRFSSTHAVCRREQTTAAFAGLIRLYRSRFAAERLGEPLRRLFDDHHAIRVSTMGVVFAMLFTVSMGTGLAQNTADGTNQIETAASLTSLRNQTSVLLRQASVSDDGASKNKAIVALCDFYVMLRQDTRFGQSEMLQQDAGKIRRRLLSTKTKLTSQLRRQKVVRLSGLSSDVDSIIRHSLAAANSDADESDRSQSSPAGDQLGRGAAGIADNGWQLVELIERVVAPDFWDTNGGPGTIQYFAMRRFLVVRATSDVHEQIRDLLRALPR
ncbi:hypothetical protein [Planctomycetes bacterium K23_9]|uniref:Uncharacterized protein n=1 Tax=Stieleria marina TaxID=1930275 RepID=A0A517NZN1_9BACT|nr:hypothetical protein K239x_45810 [Planctomycetes bacterium K23_9]